MDAVRNICVDINTVLRATDVLIQRNETLVTPLRMNRSSCLVQFRTTSIIFKEYRVKSIIIKPLNLHSFESTPWASGYVLLDLNLEFLVEWSTYVTNALKPQFGFLCSICLCVPNLSAADWGFLYVCQDG